jgi:hypothetical protein
MSLLKQTGYDGSIVRQIQQGDIQAAAETTNTVSTVGSTTLTGANLATNILTRTGSTGAFIDTLDSATNLIAALSNGLQVPQAGTTYRMRYLNTVAFAATIAGGTGTAISGTAAGVAASSWRDYLMTLTNVTPTSIQTGLVTSGSAVITGMSQAATNSVSVGQQVSGTGIPALATVIAVNPSVGITISATATVTGTLVGLTFTPVVTITSIGSGAI